MKKIVVLYGGLNERIEVVKSVRNMLGNRISNVKTYFDNEERYTVANNKIDEFSYFAGIVNYAMQRNPEIILLHDVRNKQTIEKLMQLFDVEIYTLYIGKDTSNKHDITVHSEDIENNVKEIFDKLIV